MHHNHHSRRQFLGRGAVSLAALSGPIRQAVSAPPQADDLVVLGRSCLRVSRLALGIGTGEAEAFQKMGPVGFERLIRHALDQGVRYFDLLPGPAHHMIANALRGVPREKYVLTTNFRHPHVAKPADMIPQYLRELRSDYVDCVFVGGLTTAEWAKEPKWAERREILTAAAEKGIVKAPGVSIHSYGALKSLADDPWVKLAMVGCNHKGIYMYGPQSDTVEPIRRRDAALAETRRIQAAGIGTVAMKVFAHTGFEDAPYPARERLESIRFVMHSGCVDTMPIQCESVREFDEVLRMVNKVGRELEIDT